MGDSGSIPIGYIIGFLIIQNLNLNDPYVVFFLFSYPITDVLTTIFIKTIIKKKLPWARLFDYSFLQPVIKYKKEHSYVTNKIIFVNFISLILLILYIEYQNKYLILINIGVNFFLLLLFNKKLSPRRISKIN
jgi:UDP-N-acetylmuramyl pentapeptide phosphotransferase/UDP-N-acetylglucosamine-1-phosphate transferase